MDDQFRADRFTAETRNTAKKASRISTSNAQIERNRRLFQGQVIIINVLAGLEFDLTF
jgi:hypothetical protein